jgi:hypothetical protein
MYYSKEALDMSIMFFIPKARTTLLLPLLAIGVLLATSTPAQARYVDGMNVYQYVHSNPAGYVDPQGLTADAPRASADMQTESKPGWYGQPISKEEEGWPRHREFFQGLWP